MKNSVTYEKLPSLTVRPAASPPAPLKLPAEADRLPCIHVVEAVFRDVTRFGASQIGRVGPSASARRVLPAPIGQVPLEFLS